MFRSTLCLLALTIPLAACGDKDPSGYSDTACVEDTGVDDCGGSGDGGGDDGGDDGGNDNYVPLDEAPPQTWTSDLYGSGGTAMGELAYDDSATWTSSEGSGVLSIAVIDTANNRAQLSLWDPIEVGTTYDIKAMGEGGGMPTGANLTFIEESMGGQADGGSFTITAWQETDSPQIMLLTGTLESGLITNPDDPEWVRELRNSELIAIRVASL